MMKFSPFRRIFHNPALDRSKNDALHIKGGLKPQTFAPAPPFILTTPPPKTIAAKFVEFFLNPKTIWLNSFFRHFDFGIVSETKELNFKLYSQAPASVEILSIDFIHFEGLELLGISAFQIIEPNEELPIKIIATTNGAAEINAEARIIFSNKQTLTLKFTGYRAVVFSYRPNYAYSQSITLKTDIFTAQNGTEYRSNRGSPLYSVNFSVTTKEIENSTGLKNLITYGQKMSLFLPLWYSATPLNSPLKNSFKIPLNTAFKSFKKDAPAIIWQDEKNFTFFIIESITSNSITSKKPLTADPGALIIPLFKATPNYSVNYDFITGAISAYNLEFKELL